MVVLGIAEYLLYLYPGVYWGFEALGKALNRLIISQIRISDEA